MGAEATCSVRFKRATAEGEARLETDVLQFRSADLRLSIPFKAMSKVKARGGMLRVTWSGGTAAFDLGAGAAKWAEKIVNPPSRLRKIGVKPTWRVSAIGIHDEVFLKELEDASALLSIGRVLKPSDAIFLGARKEAELTRLEKLKGSLRPDGALWIIRPKGRADISEAAVMRAGKAAGLVDVKVVSFSPTHTAEKFVIPRAARTAR
jgi:hypothetical protein